MGHASAAYRDPLESAVARVDQLEREKAELLASTAGSRRAHLRRRAGVAAAFAVLLVAAPALAWIVRGKMPPPVAETRTYEGKYTLYSWTTPTSATPTGPISLTVDTKTGKAHGWATGPVGSVRVAGQVRDRELDVLAFTLDGDARGFGSGRVVGDAMTGGFAVPKMAASASFVVEAKPQ
jgi:hypothetical protein